MWKMLNICKSESKAKSSLGTKERKKERKKERLRVKERERSHTKRRILNTKTDDETERVIVNT